MRVSVEERFRGTDRDFQPKSGSPNSIDILRYRGCVNSAHRGGLPYTFCQESGSGKGKNALPFLNQENPPQIDRQVAQTTREAIITFARERAIWALR
jgi:hypothetical protein